MFICEKNFNCCDFIYWDNTEDITEEALECGHLLEVAVIKYGDWIKPTIIEGRAFNIPHCSICNGVPCGVDNNTLYCPHCGAKMKRSY